MLKHRVFTGGLVIARGLGFVFRDFRVPLDQAQQFLGDAFGIRPRFEAQIRICRARVRGRQPVIPRSALPNALRHGGGDELVLEARVARGFPNHARDPVVAAEQIVIDRDHFAHRIGIVEKLPRNRLCHHN